jgi:hypothetical protein
MKATKQFTKYGRVAIGSGVTDYAIFTLLLFSGFDTLPSQMVARISGSFTPDSRLHSSDLRGC